LVRKREETDIDAEADDTPSSPSKKIKVAFSNDVEVRIAEEWEKTPSLIRDEVQRALERHSRGDDSGYEQLMQVFSVDSNSDEAPSSTTIRNYTVALLSNASKLNRSCSGLVRLLLQSPWLGRDDAYVSLFIRFLGNLVSVQGFWLSDVLRMLVENMASGAWGSTVVASIKANSNSATIILSTS
jgi:RNA polymerase I-specific transcription initiation factor RRN3